MNKKTLFSLLLIVAFMLSACKSAQPALPQPSEKPTEPAAQKVPEKFVFSTWGDATLYSDCFARFQKVYPEYASVQFENIQADSDTTLLQRLMTDWAAKSYDTMPDMNEISTSAIPQLADAGLLVDLTESMMPYKDKISPAVWEGIIRDGKVYAIPWMANSAMIWYRDDVFKMAGVDASTIETWDDFIAAGKKVTEFQYPDGKKRYMLSMGDPDIGSQTLQLLLGQQDTGLFDPATGETMIDKDLKFKKAFELMKRFSDEGIALRIEEWSAPWFAALGDGTIASYISANWMDQIIKGGDLGSDQAGLWRAMKLPAFDKGGSRGTLESGSANVVILAKPDAKVDMAWTMVQTCFLNDDGTADLIKAHNLVPAYLPALDDSRFTAPDEFYGGQEVGKLDKEIQQEARPFHYTADYAQAMSYIIEQLALVIAGEKTTDQGIADAAAAIRANIGNSK